MNNDLGFKGFVPGAWRVPQDFKLTDHVSMVAPILVLPDLAFLIPDALSAKDCFLLRDLFAKQNRAPVAVSGYQTADPEAIGSHRATGWGPELSMLLWKKIRFPIRVATLGHRNMNERTPTDWYEIPGKRKGHLRWKPTGISPVLRFMEYGKGGKHNTHYDMGYDYEASNPEDRRRTLLSVVWYLNHEPDTGGRTRFIEDGQDHLPINERNLDDWTRSAYDHEVRAAQSPFTGSALVFMHRMAHDVEEFTGNSRIIIRGDVEFTVAD